jgi:hypothetical protein
MAIYIDFVTDPYAAPGSKTAMLFFYSGLLLFKRLICSLSVQKS